MNRLRMALIGCGTWGEGHARLYAQDPRVELAAVCDLSAERAGALAEAFKVPGVYTDYEKMLREAPCDAVAIVTPDFAHRGPAVCAARLGKHLLIEKPLATTREDADAIVAAVRAANVRAMVDFHNRWNPPFAVMKRQVDEGAIGAPYSAYLRLNDQRWVATRMLPWAARSSILWFLGSHAVDTLRWLLGSEADTVYCLSREGLLKAEGVDAVDMYQYSIRFRSGAIAQVENGWISPNAGLNVNDFKCNLTGTRGMFNLDLSEHTLIRRYTDAEACVPDVLVNHFVRETAAGFAYQSIRSFVDRLLDGRPFDVSLADAYNTTRTILAVLEAAALGAPVRVEGLMA